MIDTPVTPCGKERFTIGGSPTYPIVLVLKLLQDVAGEYIFVNIKACIYIPPDGAL
jgi:hypothetical protein